MTGDAAMCGKPFCDGACDADLHEIPDAMQAIISETGSACAECDTNRFGFVTEYRMDERPVQLVVVWHADTCLTLVNGGYVIAALPETGLKTGAAISEALARITGEDIRAGEFALSDDRLLAKHDRGEIVLPARTVRTSRKITAREAAQATGAGG